MTSGNSWHLLRPILGSVFGLVLAMVGSLPASAGDGVAQAQAASHVERPATAPTVFVLSSREEIPAPFPTKHTLPATLSIDAFTPEEIQRIRQDVYDSIKPWDETPREGVAGCMQWVFFRTEPTALWRAFGFVGGDSAPRGLAKINGRLYPVTFNYTIEPRSRRGVVGTFFGDTAGEGPGGGAIWVRTFVPKTSYAESRIQQRDDDNLAHGFFHAGTVTDFAILDFGRTRQLVIDAADTKCTHVQARCRRYVFPVTEEAEWVLSDRELNKYKRASRIPVDVASGIRYEMAIEDMCPFGRSAMIQRSINTRMGGAEPGVRNHGLKGNASLKAALRPYVSQ